MFRGPSLEQGSKVLSCCGVGVGPLASESGGEAPSYVSFRFSVKVSGGHWSIFAVCGEIALAGRRHFVKLALLRFLYAIALWRRA